MSPESQEFYLAAARLVAAIRTVFPDPLRPLVYPATSDEPDDQVQDQHATWRGFALRDELLHPVCRRLLEVLPGLVGIRAALRAAGILLRDTPVVGPGREVYNSLFLEVFNSVWYHGRPELKPPSAELVDQMRVAARDLEFHAAPATTTELATGLADIGHVTPAKVIEYRRLNSLLKNRGVWNHSQRAAEEVNRLFGTSHTHGTFKALDNHWRGKEADKPTPDAARPRARRRRSGQ